MDTKADRTAQSRSTIEHAPVGGRLEYCRRLLISHWMTITYCKSHFTADVAALLLIRWALCPCVLTPSVSERRLFGAPSGRSDSPCSPCSLLCRSAPAALPL